MSPADDRGRAEAGFARLKTWLIEAAAPMWSTIGIDPAGGFQELIGQDGHPVTAPRRARVAPRQLYALMTAARLGASVPAGLLEREAAGFLTRYVRSDGLVRSLVDPDGRALDNGATLYDQAFALLAMACLKPLLGVQVEARAVALRAAMVAVLGNEGGGFWSAAPPPAQLLSNPHMHLLEACLAWVEADGDADWTRTAEHIVGLALERLIDPVAGLRETFDDSWAPAPGQAGRIIEPGHQFEWAWLLLRWSRLTPSHPWTPKARAAAVRLVRIGEERGVDPARNVAINSLLDDFSVCDGEARLWPQTERIKAWADVSAHLGEPGWGKVADAVDGLEAYLKTSTPGLWFDLMTADGVLVDAPAPASSFYHIVCAIETLGAALLGQPS